MRNLLRDSRLNFLGWIFALVFFPSFTQAQNLQDFAMAKIVGAASHDFAFSQISLNDRYAVLRTGSFESVDYLYRVKPNASGFTLIPLPPPGPNWRLGESEVQIRLKNKFSSSASLVDNLLTANQQVMIHFSPRDSNDYTAVGFKRIQIDENHFRQGGAEPSDGASDDTPSPGQIQRYRFASAKIVGAASHDFAFSKISLNNDFAILRTGSFESMDHLYRVVRNAEGFTLIPLPAPGPNWRQGDGEVQIRLKSKPAKDASLLETLLNGNQEITIEGAPKGHGTFIARKFAEEQIACEIPLKPKGKK
jgi:hypothetical protein